MMRVAGKRAAVTGGASGIGAATCRRLAAEGATVVVLDVNEEAASSLLPAPHFGLACDVTDTTSVDATFATIQDRLGGIDILVNNAARGSAPNDGLDKFYAGQAERQAQIERGETPTAFADQTIHCSDEGWSRVLDVSLNSAFRCTRAAVRLMAEEGIGGSIINIGSTSAVRGDGPLPYVTAKAAILGMTRSLARELADRGIRVNAVNPGATLTPIYSTLSDTMIEALKQDSVMKRLAEPDEIAGAVAFLAGTDGQFATGSIVTVNGGAYFS